MLAVELVPYNLVDFDRLGRIAVACKEVLQTQRHYQAQHRRPLVVVVAAAVVVVDQDAVVMVFVVRDSALVELYTLSCLSVLILFLDECVHLDRQRSVKEL